MSDDRKEGPMGQVIQIDEARIQDHLGEMVRGTVEETLNALLDAEADRLCGPVNQGAGDQPQTQGYSRSGEPRSGADQGRCRGRGVAR